MAAVFGGSTKIGRTVVDPGTDKSLPSPGSLGWTTITSQMAVGVTAGADVALVHGDQWQSLDGRRAEFIDKDVSTTILGNEDHEVTGNRTKQITGNHTETVVGSQNLTSVGSHTELYCDPKTETYASPRCELNAAPRCRAEPTPTMNILGIEFEKKDFEATYIVQGAEIAIQKFEVFAVKQEAGGLHQTLTVAEWTTTGIGLENTLVKLDVEALKSHTFGAKPELGGGKVGVHAGVNAVPGPVAVVAGFNH
jgi:hypothetical protein